MSADVVCLSDSGGRDRGTFKLCGDVNVVKLLITTNVFSFFMGSGCSLTTFLAIITCKITTLLSFKVASITSPGGRGRLSLRVFGAVLHSAIKGQSFIMFLVTMTLLARARRAVAIFLDRLRCSHYNVSDSAVNFLCVLVAILKLFNTCSISIAGQVNMGKTLLLFNKVFTLSYSVLTLTPCTVPSILDVNVLQVAGALFRPLRLRVRGERVGATRHTATLDMYSVLVDDVNVMAGLIFNTLST